MKSASKHERQRLDVWLVENNFAESRQKAQAMILAGQVLVNEQRAEKAGQPVPDGAAVRVRGEGLRYVGRGGLKLEGALREFSIDVRDCLCLDAGASTGGFTDCLLQHGARRVHAVDVGHNQLVWKLRTDDRVVVREGVNARYLSPADFEKPFDVVTCDLSFISLAKVLPALATLLTGNGRLIALVKPQFEVGREEVGKGGLVRDPRLHRKAVEIVARAAREAGLEPLRLMRSPIEGADGNVEFSLAARKAAESIAEPSAFADSFQTDFNELFSLSGDAPAVNPDDEPHRPTAHPHCR